MDQEIDKHQIDPIIIYQFWEFAKLNFLLLMLLIYKGFNVLIESIDKSMRHTIQFGFQDIKSRENLINGTFEIKICFKPYHYY